MKRPTKLELRLRRIHHEYLTREVLKHSRPDPNKIKVKELNITPAEFYILMRDKDKWPSC